MIFFFSFCCFWFRFRLDFSCAAGFFFGDECFYINHYAVYCLFKKCMFKWIDLGIEGDLCGFSLSIF